MAAQTTGGPQQVRRAAIFSVAAAALLVVLKLGVGLATGSLALVSAGIESSGDVGAAVLTYLAVRLGGRPADRDHPYGHRRAENLGALGEAAILLAGAGVVAAEAVSRLTSDHGPPELRWTQFAVLGAAVFVDGARIRASLAAARAHGSPAMRSNAMHFAGDMAGSLAVLVGLLLVKAGWLQADSVAALVVAAIIVPAALRLLATNANVLMDRAPEDARGAAERAVAQVGHEVELSRLRLRESAGRYFADVVVSVPAGQAVVEGHRAADLVEAAVQRALPGSDVVVHVEPRALGLDLRDRVLAIALSEPLVKEAHDISIFQARGETSVSLHLKFPAGLDLAAADEVAARIEREIAERPGVADVQTHLEPLEQPLAARPEPGGGPEEDEAVRRVVRERTGQDPQRVRIIATDSGTVLFVTLGLPAGEPLPQAHELAGELEELLRARIEGIADVVVRTAPGEH